ncbi:peptidase inhibitor family I36 protein [Streptomyces goshikiensis]
MSLAAVTAATCVALTGAASPSQAPTGERSASAALQRAADQCGAGEICLWKDRNYSGTPWRWRPSSGRRDLPHYQDRRGEPTLLSPHHHVPS